MKHLTICCSFLRRGGLLAGLILALSLPCAGQGYEARFGEALESQDVARQRAILAEWEKAVPGDVELYIARYNYYFHLDDPQYDSALACLDEAIALYPTRLDLRFGKAFLLRTIERWDDFVDVIVSTLDHSETIGHRWQFPNYDGDGEAIVTEGVQDYMVLLFSQIDDPSHMTAADSAMTLRLRRVAKRTAQVFPSDVQALNFLHISYTLFGEYDKALRYLKRAEAIDPTDPVIRQNLNDLRERVGE